MQRTWQNCFVFLYRVPKHALYTVFSLAIHSVCATVSQLNCVKSVEYSAKAVFPCPQCMAVTIRYLVGRLGHVIRVQNHYDTVCWTIRLILTCIVYGYEVVWFLADSWRPALCFVWWWTSTTTGFSLLPTCTWHSAAHCTWIVIELVFLVQEQSWKMRGTALLDVLLQ